MKKENLKIRSGLKMTEVLTMKPCFGKSTTKDNNKEEIQW